MARLATSNPTRQVVLPARCLIGRSRGSDLVLPQKQVSGQHATIEWTGTFWQIRDLNSSNGTLLGGRALAPGESAPLRPGAELNFGRKTPTWRLVESDPPVLMALCLSTGAQVVGAGGYLVVPDAQRPELAIYQDREGHWLAEAHGASRPVEDRSVYFTASQEEWRVYLPVSDDRTLKDTDSPLVLTDLCLRFAYTRDEEHVELSAAAEGRCFDLKARAHHYPLLLLARQRLADLHAGLSRAEQGWIRHEDLLKMLRIDDNHLNISIHRARAQLGQIGVADAARLVERRTTTRQLRIGAERLELMVLDSGEQRAG